MFDLSLTDAQSDAKVSALLQTLCETWHNTIPASKFMQITPVLFNGDSLQVTAPIDPNINLHHTMFAGSIYTLMTLTGWGMVWLQQQLSQAHGDIVLADAKVRYLKPVTKQPYAKVIWPYTDLTPLTRGQLVKITLEVALYCDEIMCATFTGQFVSFPPKIVSSE
ncbi:MAG: thioesterase domain-containing protein [Shewanella psychromarinicola]|uniref:thioesterase domain-containing protein n=1 Tax=Shewanella psychromarinicola TaxID=2487742 RepID=UPI0030027CAD